MSVDEYDWHDTTRGMTVTVPVLRRSEPGSLLHLDSSVGVREESVSRRLTGMFAAVWKQVNGSAGYRYRDLAADPVPLIGPAYTNLGRRLERSGLVPPDQVAALLESPAERREWALTLPLITELRAAETVLIGAPMYNFSIPAGLKAWIDRLTFPGAFTDPETGERALAGLRVVVVSARGGAYGPGAPREGFDFQTPYLRGYFTNLGVCEENLSFVHAEMTLANLVPPLAAFQQYAADSLATAETAVTKLAKRPTHLQTAR